MSSTEPNRHILAWVRPAIGQRYEIFAPDWGIPQGVLTVNGPVTATLETPFGTYTFQRQALSTGLQVADADGAPVAAITTNWRGLRQLRFYDGRELRFGSSSFSGRRWLWSNAEGEARAVVRDNQIFFAPDWPVREGLSALLAGITIYLLISQPSFFSILPNI